jgi:PBP1b-binding outer membrane lipoprotein LpoB
MIKWHPMKRYSIALAICLFLSGCGSKSYEQEAGLTPLPAPVALAGTDASSSKLKAEVETFESPIVNAETVADAEASITRLTMAKELVSGLSGIAGIAEAGSNNTNQAQLDKEMNDGMNFFERAATIKKLQLEAGDKTDSTGEVAKYVNYARQSYANLFSLQSATQ